MHARGVESSAAQHACKRLQKHQNHRLRKEQLINSPTASDLSVSIKKKLTFHRVIVGRTTGRQQ